VTANVELRAELEPLSDYKLIEAAAALEPTAAPADPDAAMEHTLGSLGRRWLVLHQEVKDHSRQLKLLTRQVAPLPVWLPSGLLRGSASLLPVGTAGFEPATP
jgi:hypothetical protein